MRKMYMNLTVPFPDPGDVGRVTLVGTRAADREGLPSYTFDG